MIDLARSTYYYRSQADEARAKENADIRDRLEQLALKFPRYGYRRMTAQLRREGWSVTHKRVLRLMRESVLLVQRRRRFVRTTDSDHGLPVFPNLLAEFTATGIDQVWVSDIERHEAPLNRAVVKGHHCQPVAADWPKLRAA